ncbi:MAG: tetratricopeptide repeat protein [Alphaproteobacteria bacterium]|nr:tetratricopeptide repeat protein [Alphaproteobacteria bacterium]
MGEPEGAAEILAWASARLATGSDEALRSTLAAAVVRFPGHAALAQCHADALQIAGAYRDAAAAYRRVLALDRQNPGAWFGLGCAELERHAYGDAVAALRQAAALLPEVPAPRFNLAKALFELGEVDEAVDLYRQIAARRDGALRAEALAALACIIPGAPRADNAAILAARRAWAAVESPGARPRPAPAPRRERLRIGYVSAFLGDRNWMKPVAGAINHHDRGRFELHFFSDGGRPDEAAGWRDFPTDVVHEIAGMSNDRLAAIVARIGIDVLVDLNGYSFQRRLGLFMRRPAPVMVGWFNQFAPSGIDAFDAVIGDEAVIPPSEERFYGERVLRVPGSYLAFSVPYRTPDPVAPPVLAGGRLTFGCLSSQYKMTDLTLDAWGAILRAAPDTRLLVKNRTLGDASSRMAFLARLARHGIGPERVELEGPDDHDAFLAAYGRVDIALDTLPYSAGTTAMEALWQGVPVLTWNGDRWAARTCRSLLQAAGLGAWCRDSRDAFVARGIELARAPETPAMLAALRATLRPTVARSPACDSEGLCRALEAIYADLAASVAR